MKTFFVVLFVVLGITGSYGQEKENPTYQGDNFSLEGALAMFKKAKSLKNFERIINDKINNVNNLDLNDDGEIDFVNVDDIKSGDTHIILLSTYLSETEKQDVATISIEKTGETEAYIQIEGDSDLYAQNTIIEPTEEKESLKDSNEGGPNTPIIEVKTMVINVWFWPCVTYIYAPNYVIWKSPYRWGYRANWWRPWHPFTPSLFYVRCAPHRLWYSPGTTRMVVAARSAYAPMRRSSTLVVHNRKGITIAHEKIKITKTRNNIPIKKIKMRNPPVKRGTIKGVRTLSSRRK